MRRAPFYAVALLLPVALAFLGSRFGWHPWTHPGLWVPLALALCLRLQHPSWAAVWRALRD